MTPWAQRRVHQVAGSTASWLAFAEVGSVLAGLDLPASPGTLPVASAGELASVLASAAVMSARLLAALQVTWAPTRSGWE